MENLNGTKPGDAGSVAIPAKKLCETCKDLNLSVDKFIIYDGTLRPSKQPHPSPRDYRHHQGFSLKSGSYTHRVGTLDDIQARSRICSFCYLVLKSVEKPAAATQENPEDTNHVATRTGANSDVPNHVATPTESNPTVLNHVPTQQTNLSLLNPNAVCYLNWEIDGRDNDRSLGPKARTRRLHLYWDDKALKDSYLVFVAPQRLFDFNSDSQGSWEKEAFFLGRELKKDGNNQVLIKSWLDQCYQQHGKACASEQSPEFVEMASKSYFGVIDTLDMCIKSLPPRIVKRSQKDSDSASSPVLMDIQTQRYRYGSASPSIDTEREHDLERGHDLEREHETIIYEPYVALSYVWGKRKNYTTDISNIRVHQQQGSLETVLDKIPRVIRDAMDIVRRLGLRFLWVDSLCIVQDSKRSWNLNSRVMDLIYGHAFLTICAADGYDAYSGLRALSSSGNSPSQYIEECVPGVRLMVSQLAETGINSSVWNTRAWTFQERLLSKRCLIFTEGRVFFQCRSATMSEDLVSESRGAGWSLDLAKALPQILHELKRRPIKVYMNCMSRYSERKLTQPKDILAAFNGVSNLISRAMRAPFIFGLPSSHFDLALLWEPLQGVKRRVQQPGEDYQDLVFPSWSWCGWQGGPMEYRSSQVEGVLTNVSEWLTEHTWIAWYIRDGRGNVRPIWDGAKSKACDSVEDRWRGYNASRPDVEFTNYQTEALENLGDSSKDDFNKWAKEQEQTESRAKKELREIEFFRVKKGWKEQGIYDDEDERGNRHHQDYRGRNYDRYGQPARIVSVSPRRRRHRDMESDGLRTVGGDDQESPRTLRDEYGRNISVTMARKIRSGFHQCLPDNPFRVYLENYTSHPDKDFPDQPLLQFWTWWAPLQLVQSPTQTIDLPGLTKYDIADQSGDWCGSIILDQNFVQSEKERGHKVEGSIRNFLAISDARAFTKEECDVWTYYVPKERENSEWDLYYVFLVQQRDRIWYRVALGKVFKASFENAAQQKRWREIILG